MEGPPEEALQEQEPQAPVPDHPSRGAPPNPNPHPLHPNPNPNPNPNANPKVVSHWRKKVEALARDVLEVMKS